MAPAWCFDAVFTSKELAETFADVEQPVVVIGNFLSKAEIEAKGLPVIQDLIAGKA